jgi:hypothetical protein
MARVQAEGRAVDDPAVVMPDIEVVRHEADYRRRATQTLQLLLYLEAVMVLQKQHGRRCHYFAHESLDVSIGV